MKAKKYEMTVNYGQGEEIETRYYNPNLGSGEIEKIFAEEYDFGPFPIVDYIGIVDIDETLGKDFVDNGGEYISKADSARRMMEEFSNMCPNNH